MTMIGVRAQNHPQQTAIRGPLDDVDDRWTPPELFAELSALAGGFDLDVAASPENALCPRYFTVGDDALTQHWTGRAWLNPPFSNLGAWLAKAWQEWNTGDLDALTMLLPANRVEQSWWQEHVEPYRDRAGSPLTVRFLPGRLRFKRPGWTVPTKGDRPPFGCCVLSWTR